MLFMVISTPRPERPSTQTAARQQFWPWMQALQQQKQARWCYARPGRGAVALFDVATVEALHAYLNQWADMIPAQFDIYPLIDASAAVQFLGQGKTDKPTAVRKGRARSAKPRSPAA